MNVETPARWAPDPSGRHQHRFWNGATWTEFVADEGTPFLDPAPVLVPWPGAGTPSPTTPGTPGGPAEDERASASRRTPTRPIIVPPRAAPEGAPGALSPAPGVPDEPRPTRGPNRLPSHRERRTGRGRPILLVTVAVTVLGAVLAGLGVRGDDVTPVSSGTPTSTPSARALAAPPPTVTRATPVPRAADPVSSVGQRSHPGRKLGKDPHLADCSAVRRAGLGPYLRWRDAEYTWYSDPDDDGIACE